MSNKTQLAANNTQLASLIQTLQEKASGGSSGGSLDTCTVTIKSSVSVYINYYGATVVNNGVVEGAHVDQNNSYYTEAVLENVLCGSMLYVSCSTSGYDVSVENGVTDIGFVPYYTRILRAPETAGASGVVNFISNM